MARCNVDALECTVCCLLAVFVFMCVCAIFLWIIDSILIVSKSKLSLPIWSSGVGISCFDEFLSQVLPHIWQISIKQINYYIKNKCVYDAYRHRHSFHQLMMMTQCLFDRWQIIGIFNTFDSWNNRHEFAIITYSFALKKYSNT